MSPAAIRYYCIVFLQACRILIIGVLLSLGAPLCSALQESDFIVHAESNPIATSPTAYVAAGKVKKSTRLVAPPMTYASSKPAVPASQTPACLPFTGPANATPVTAPTIPGLKIVADTPDFYTIYGNSVAAVHAQLLSCQPNHAYAASTSYWIGAQYSYVTPGNGTCKLTNVSVMLRTHQVFPLLATTTNTPAALRARWQEYISALSVHEHGHVTINQQYAQQALQTLQNLPPTTCAQIDTAANGIMANITTKMRTANDAYDARTNHGATQGAIWR